MTCLALLIGIAGFCLEELHAYNQYKASWWFLMYWSSPRISRTPLETCCSMFEFRAQGSDLWLLPAQSIPKPQLKPDSESSDAVCAACAQIYWIHECQCLAWCWICEGSSLGATQSLSMSTAKSLAGSAGTLRNACFICRAGTHVVAAAAGVRPNLLNSPKNELIMTLLTNPRVCLKIGYPQTWWFIMLEDVKNGRNLGAHHIPRSAGAALPPSNSADVAFQLRWVAFSAEAAFASAPCDISEQESL